MRNVVCPRAPELRTLWIRTRELGISLRSWRPRYHGGPPMVKYGPKDTDVTPVVTRDYSPGLPQAGWDRYSARTGSAAHLDAPGVPSRPSGATNPTGPGTRASAGESRWRSSGLAVGCRWHCGVSDGTPGAQSARRSG